MRFIRAAQSQCAGFTSVIGFSLLLTFVFILHQGSVGPGISQRLGWQSWEVVDVSDAPSHTEHPTTATTSPPDDKTTDWWNVTESVGQVDTASLPLDQWSPLLPHDTGLSELTLSRCVLPPGVAQDLCAPKSNSEQDAIRGKWVRVERNLNKEGGMWYLNLYYRRTRRQDINLITNIRVLPAEEEPFPITGWKKVAMSIRDGIPRTPKLFLWYQTGKTLADMSADERKNIITELDVIYGEDRPWYGFEKLDKPTMPEVEGKYDSVWLSFRRGVKIAPRAPPLHFSRSGMFKILQIADLHFSVGFGSCRDTDLTPCTHSDNLTMTLLGQALDAEKPDLVIFSGDQLNGQGTSWDPKSVLAKFSRAVEERAIPWATVFGNHDEEGGGVGGDKESQMSLIKALPYSVSERGPKDIAGVGNYVLKVKSADPSRTHLLTLYFLDSGSYSKGVFDWFGFWTPTAYDWLRQSQINWFLQESASVGAIERPFTPDGAKDFGSIWRRESIALEDREEQRRQNQVTPQNAKKLAKPNALMFFHIPMQESYNIPADKNPLNGRPLDVGIQGLETAGSAKGNDGFFDKALLTAMASEHDRSGGYAEREVKVVGNGHCHVTENCRRVKGVWLCFGGGGSYSGYGKIGFDRRFRIYDISDYGETIRTYKRTEHGDIVDEMTLAGKGAPPPPLDL